MDIRHLSLGEKCPNTEFFLGPYFPAFGLNTPYLSVRSPNTGKYGPQKIMYLDTFHAVCCYETNSQPIGNSFLMHSSPQSRKSLVKCNLENYLLNEKKITSFKLDQSLFSKSFSGTKFWKNNSIIWNKSFLDYSLHFLK